MALSPLAADPRFPWTEAQRAEGGAAGRALAEAGAAGHVAAAREAARRLREMLEGVERYQSHPYARRMPEPETVWRAGSARLLDYGEGGDGPVALAIPSLVNRAYVLDLHPRRSLLRWLATQGLRPMLLDWGDPGPRERGFDLGDYHAHRLIPAAEAAAARAAGGQVAAFGYCMGGAFAAALAAQRPDLVARLALIGAPWDFSRLEGAGAALAAAARRHGAEAQIRGLGDAFGAIPVDVLQTMFAALDPTLALRKFRRFRALPEASEATELFVATEDWLNDGPPLSAPAARELAVDWYARNLPSRGLWRPGGAAARAEAVRAPTLAFCSAADRIAPSACAEALPRAVPGARILRPATGHVGMIVGGAAESQVWRPLADFLGGR